MSQASGAAALHKEVPSSSGAAGESYVKKLFRWDPRFACIGHGEFGMEQLSHKDLWHDLLAKLQNHSTMKWQELNAASGGRRSGNNHHVLEPSRDLTDSGHDAWEKQPDDLRDMPLFSLRLSAKQRIIGFRDSAVFFPVWYDPGHNFAKTSRR